MRAGTGLEPEGAVLEYHVVDVFTSSPFAGNPLAVVLDSDGLSGHQLQLLAREFHLSETAFPQQPTADERAEGADYRLRIFTPDVELPFAGHPSVGTAWLLTELGRLGRGRLLQACGAGVLPIEVADDGSVVTLTGGEARVSSPIDPSAALAAVGLAAEHLAGPPSVVAGTGLGFAVVPVSPSSLAEASPDLESLRRVFRHPNDATGVYLVAWDAGQVVPAEVRSRMFAGDVGVTEDAATGSAALALGAALPAIAPVPDGPLRCEVVQGVEMGRPSRLVVDVDVAGGRARRVQVSGGVVRIARGQIAIPPA